MHPTTTFDDLYLFHKREILALSRMRKHGVPGLDADDIASEMATCLYRAWVTYLPGRGAFGTYWWSLWLNRRADLIEAAEAQKRPTLVPVDTVPDNVSYRLRIAPEPPPNTSPAGRALWKLLGAGLNGKEARNYTDLSRRAYYDLIATWRTDEVYEYLQQDA